MYVQSSEVKLTDELTSEIFCVHKLSAPLSMLSRVIPEPD